jgi:hypothetical protein
MNEILHALFCQTKMLQELSFQHGRSILAMRFVGGKQPLEFHHSLWTAILGRLYREDGLVAHE